MDLCNQLDLHGPSCLYVTGIDETCTDKEINDFFEVNGDIEKIVRVPDKPDKPKGRTLIQYSSEQTISRLDPANLGNLPSPYDPTLTWHVRSIREVCQEDLGRELARRCLAELSTLAGKSKAGFWDMLQHDLQHVQPDSAPPQSPDTHFETLDQHGQPASGDIPELNPPKSGCQYSPSQCSQSSHFL